MSETKRRFGPRRRTRELEAEIGRLRMEITRLVQLRYVPRETPEEAELRRLNERCTDAEARLKELQREIAAAEEVALLQAAGVFADRQPLSGERRLVREQIEAMVLADQAVTGSTTWALDGSLAQGRKVVRDFAKLTLRAFNAEADSLLHRLEPAALPTAVERLKHLAATIERLGQTMDLRITEAYQHLRVRELELTAAQLQKQISGP